MCFFCRVVLCSLFLVVSPSLAAAQSKRAARKKPVRTPEVRLLVRDFVVAPGQPMPPAPARRRRRRYHRFHRQTTPLFLKNAPNGKNLSRLTVGIQLEVLEKRGEYIRVRTLGHAQVEGYVPESATGLRVLRKTDILASPSTTRKIGEAQPGVLVRVVATRGAFTRAMLMGPCPVLVWFKSEDLGVADGENPDYGAAPARGANMIVTKGPVYDKPGGRVIGEVVEEASAERDQVSGKWAKIRLTNFRYYTVEGWVPNSRMLYGYYGYWRGNGYSQSSRSYSSGDMTAIMRLPLYLEKDDAYPTAVLEPGTFFRITQESGDWVTIQYQGNLQFTAYARRAPGAWAPRSGQHQPVRGTPIVR